MTVPANIDIELAEGLGAAAARAGQDVDTCPFPRDGSGQDLVLRRRWLLGFAGDGGLDEALFAGTPAR